MGQVQAARTISCNGGCYADLCNLLNDMTALADRLGTFEEDYGCLLYSCLSPFGCVCAHLSNYDYWLGTTHCHYELQWEGEIVSSSGFGNSSSSNNSIRDSSRNSTFSSIRSPSVNSTSSHFRIPGPELSEDDIRKRSIDGKKDMNLNCVQIND